MNNDYYEEYIETLEGLDDTFWNMLEQQAREEEGRQWVAVDLTQFGCLFLNDIGEARYVSADYIDKLFN